MSTKRFILMALQTLRLELGVVSEIHDTGGDDFVILFNDNPGNSGERFSIAKTLDILTNVRLIELVGVEGAWGNVDTHLLSSIPGDDIRQRTLDNLMVKLQIHPGEYCHALAKTPFVLYGLEDENLYRKADQLWNECTPARDYFNRLARTTQITQQHIEQAPAEIKILFGKINEYSAVLEQRVSLMLRNLLAKMSEMHLHTSAVIACTPLVDGICQKMKQTNISYAKIRPFTATQDDLERYEKVIASQFGRAQPPL